MCIRDRNNTTYTFSSYVEQLVAVSTIYPSSNSTIINMKEFMKNPNNSAKSILTDLANTQLQERGVKYEKRKGIFGETLPGLYKVGADPPPALKYDIKIKKGYIMLRIFSKERYRFGNIPAGQTSHD